MHMGLRYHNIGDDAEEVKESWFANRTLGCFPGTPRTLYPSEPGAVHWASVENQFFAMIAIPDEPAPGLVTEQLLLPVPGPDVIAEHPKANKAPKAYQNALTYPAQTLQPGEFIEQNPTTTTLDPETTSAWRGTPFPGRSLPTTAIGTSSVRRTTAAFREPSRPGTGTHRIRSDRSRRRSPSSNVDGSATGRRCPSRRGTAFRRSAQGVARCHRHGRCSTGRPTACRDSSRSPGNRFDRWRSRTAARRRIDRSAARNTARSVSRSPHQAIRRSMPRRSNAPNTTPAANRRSDTRATRVRRRGMPALLRRSRPRERDRLQQQILSPLRHAGDVLRHRKRQPQQHGRDDRQDVSEMNVRQFAGQDAPVFVDEVFVDIGRASRSSPRRSTSCRIEEREMRLGVPVHFGPRQTAMKAPLIQRTNHEKRHQSREHDRPAERDRAQDDDEQRKDDRQMQNPFRPRRRAMSEVMQVVPQSEPGIRNQAERQHHLPPPRRPGGRRDRRRRDGRSAALRFPRDVPGMCLQPVHRRASACRSRVLLIPRTTPKT